MTIETWAWVLFNLFVVAMLAIDLGVFHRTAHRVRIREALAWTAVWISLALAFAGLVLAWHGPHTALQFLTGYVIELSLSVDNLFVFLLIFHYFQVPAQNQHRVLFWGILGALGMRLVFILAGIALISRFGWVSYLFGAFLVFTGIKLFFEKDKKIHPERNPVLRLFRRWMPVAEGYESDRFFIRREGVLMATPLFVVLLVVETTDVLFAADSIPAILAVSRDSFIVYTSNVFAILGLRSLYFALAGLMRLFHYLHYGLALVLVFVGVKMVIAETGYELPIGITLGVVCGVLAGSVGLSLLFPPKKEDTANLGEGAAPSTDGATPGSDSVPAPPDNATPPH